MGLKVTGSLSQSQPTHAHHEIKVPGRMCTRLYRTHHCGTALPSYKRAGKREERQGKE